MNKKRFVVAGLALGGGFVLSALAAACSSSSPNPGQGGYVDGGADRSVGDAASEQAQIAPEGGDGGGLMTFAYPADPGRGRLLRHDLRRVERAHRLPVPAGQLRVRHVHARRLAVRDPRVHRRRRQGHPLVEPRLQHHRPVAARLPGRPPRRPLRRRPAQGRQDRRPGRVPRAGDAHRRHHQPERQRQRAVRYVGRHPLRLRLQHRPGDLRRLQREPRRRARRPTSRSWCRTGYSVFYRGTAAWKGDDPGNPYACVQTNAGAGQDAGLLTEGDASVATYADGGYDFSPDATS